MAWNRPHFPFLSFMGGGSILLSKPEQERKEGRKLQTLSIFIEAAGLKDRQFVQWVKQ